MFSLAVPSAFVLPSCLQVWAAVSYACLPFTELPLGLFLPVWFCVPVSPSLPSPASLNVSRNLLPVCRAAS